jgi:DNA polymerase III subunit beta
MRAIVDHADLRAALSLLVSVVEKRPTVPILSNVLISADDSETLRLVCTDLEVTGIVTIPARVADTSGPVTVEASALLDLAKSVNDALTIDSTDSRMKITSGAAKFELPVLAGADFPALADMQNGEEIELSPSDILQMVRAVSYAMPHGGEPAYCAGVNLAITKTSIDVTATNRIALASATLKRKGREQDSMLLPSKLVNACAQLAVGPDALVVRLKWTSDHVAISLGRTTLIGRRPDTRFPDYAEWLNDDKHKYRLFANRAELMTAIRRVTPFTESTSKLIVMELSNDSARVISRRSNRGNSEDTVPIKFSGELRLGVGANHLLAALESIHTSAVEIALTDPGERATLIVLPVESEMDFSLVNIVVPITLKDGE